MSITLITFILYYFISIIYPAFLIYKIIKNGSKIDDFWLLYFIFYYALIIIDENFFYPLTDL